MPHRVAPNTQNILPSFYLPSLRGIAVSIDHPPGPALAWPVTHQPLANQLVSLALTLIRESHLGQLLHHLPREWRFDPDFENQCSSPIIDLDLLMPWHTSRTR